MPSFRSSASEQHYIEKLVTANGDDGSDPKVRESSA